MVKTQGRGRAWRRAQQKRIIAHTSRVFRRSEFLARELAFNRIVRHSANNRTTCSAACCGNPRHWFNEPTIQERRAFQVDMDDDS